ncbi:MAG: hypothetical protein H8E16_15845 [Flavobacteriales bacterium]|nr:hypothetical protein [Flavobacteriales bacterium]
MEGVLKVLAENIEGSLISSLVILVLAFMFLFKKDIPVWINRVLSLKNKLTINSLQHHDLFNTCVRVEKEVSLMKFYSHGQYDIIKSKMCKDFVKYKIKICTKGFEDILKVNIEGITPDAFKKYIIDTQNKMHVDYINAIREDWRGRNISEDNIKYVVELFETFRYDVVKAFEYRINSIFSSTSHTNNTRRLLAIFEMWAFGIDILPRDMHTTFETLNGIFKEIDY